MDYNKARIKHVQIGEICSIAVKKTKSKLGNSMKSLCAFYAYIFSTYRTMRKELGIVLK